MCDRVSDGAVLTERDVPQHHHQQEARMYHPYTFDKVHACRHDELLREAHHWQHYTAWRAAQGSVPRRPSLMVHVRQVLRRLTHRGHVRWSEG